MRRVLLAHRYLDRAGGTSRVVWHLAQELSRDYEVHVLTSHVGERVPGVTIHRIPGMQRPLSLAVFWTAVAYTLWSVYGRRRWGFSVIHGSNDELIWPDVVTAYGVHRSGIRRRQTNAPRRGLRGRARDLLRKVVRYAPLDLVVLLLEWLNLRAGPRRSVIAISPETRDEVIAEYGVAPERVVVVPLGVDLSELEVPDAVLRAEARRVYHAEGVLTIVTVATEIRRKGIPELVEATAMLAPEFPNLRTLIGGRANPADLGGLVDRLGVGDRVTFVGKVANLSRFLAAGDVFALPTKYEGFGLTILEAMAAGLPVVVSPTGVGGLLRDGENGIVLQDPNDVHELAARLRDLLKDPDRRVRLGQGARAFAERMTWRVCADATARIYEEVAAERERRRRLRRITGEAT